MRVLVIGKRTEITIRVRFLTTEEGGRINPLNGNLYDHHGCALIIDGEAFECRLWLSKILYELGNAYELPLQFLNWNMVKPLLQVGKACKLWEGKISAEGEILSIEME